MSLLMKKILQGIKSLNDDKADKVNITTGVEFKTGRIIDGKVEYGKIFEVEALASIAGNTVIATELTNITPIRLEGYIKGATLVSNLPFIYTGQNSVYHYCNASGNSITIRTTGDMSMYSVIETLYYTKN